MALLTPRTPQGVMELLPTEQLAFQKFADIVRHAFTSFGFVPIETPAFEFTNILLNKEGGETEKQVYFVQSQGSLNNDKAPEMALRFDNTVPLARYVAEHEHQLAFPFRRYQMQRVYRGERPQKGRYREFYQFDIDVIGKDELALAYDAELPAIIHGIFSQLNVGGYTISMNNRKLLKGLLNHFGITTPEQQTAVLHEVDRLDKMPMAEVLPRLLVPEVGLSEAVAEELLAFVCAKRSNTETLLALAALSADATSQLALGTAELKQVYDSAVALGVPDSVMCLSLSTVRGLDYYTGTVYETRLHEAPSLGAICAGGRYENLAGLYTKSHLPGVGIAIGATRLFYFMMERGWGQDNPPAHADALVVQVEPALLPDYFELAKELRAAGLKIEVYVDAHKMGKQLKYADRTRTPFAIIMGGDEKAKGVVTLKHLLTSTQEELPREALAARLQALLQK